MSVKSLARWVTALLLTFALTACGQEAVTTGRYPDKEHQPVDYADMVYTGFDETNLQAALEKLKELHVSGNLQNEDARIREEVNELYRVIREETNILFTQSALIEILYNGNGAEEELGEASAEISARINVLMDQCYQTLALLVDTPYQDVIEKDAGEENIAALREYEAVPEKLFELQEKEEALVQTYDQIMSLSFQVTVDGRTWTEEELIHAEIDEKEYQKILAQLEQERNQKAGDIYRRLVQVRTDIAHESGCDNYVDFAYAEIFHRDYTGKDIQAVWEKVKEYIVPLEDRILDGFSSRELRGLMKQTSCSGEEILDAIQPYMRKIDPELGETFAFMRRHRLYDIEYSDNKLLMGYTVALPQYGTAFIFNQPYGDYQDFIDTIHEFGHFNETFHCTQHDMWANFNIDVGEIHSQGLTLLFTEYSDELFGQYGEVFSRIVIWNVLDSITDGCRYDEFQTAVYQNPDMSLEEINRLYQQISEQYGYTPEEGEDYGWVLVGSNFQTPLYYISYATSALSSLDLWLLSLEDRDRAVDIYLELAALSLSLPYRQTIEEVGLRDVFRPETISDMAEELEEQIEGMDEEDAGRAA